VLAPETIDRTIQTHLSTAARTRQPSI